ncbi:unnamed protein product [Gongylonema pulchrum]|uniref:Uncharacterized protein n=1 Tax=Gongylonema pulchrum TaxID=637853 RepID=A0A183E9W0_9BILA|nr:unnamed protein product [Gongylonema pulchrum]
MLLFPVDQPRSRRAGLRNWPRGRERPERERRRFISLARGRSSASIQCCCSPSISRAVGGPDCAIGHEGGNVRSANDADLFRLHEDGRDVAGGGSGSVDGGAGGVGGGAGDEFHGWRSIENSTRSCYCCCRCCFSCTSFPAGGSGAGSSGGGMWGGGGVVSGGGYVCILIPLRQIQTRSPVSGAMSCYCCCRC